MILKAKTKARDGFVFRRCVRALYTMGRAQDALQTHFKALWSELSSRTGINVSPHYYKGLRRPLNAL